MHGRAYGQAENGQGRAGKGQRKRPRFAGVACDGLALDCFGVRHGEFGRIKGEI